MGKKKFIDKKKSATFQLFARDSSDPNYADEPGSDRVFVRVDNNPYSVDLLSDENHDEVSNQAEDPNSIYADAPEDVEDDDEDVGGGLGRQTGLKSSSAPFSEHVRKEILELGFPDDGYNYLLHMREIRNTGGGSAYYQNPKAKIDQLPLDVKAYDASRVPIPKVDENSDERSIYNVASQAVGVRVQRVVDPEVTALLDDDDMSRFGSDVEDLEEDFIVRANLREEGEDVIIEKKLDVDEFGVSSKELNISKTCGLHENVADFNGVDEARNHFLKTEGESVGEKPRVRRLLDEQFDLLECQEYASDSDDDYCGSIAEEDEALAEKLNYHTLKDHALDDSELDGKYRAPADLLHDNERPQSKEMLDSAAHVIRRCVEYGEKYANEDDEVKDDMFMQESSDESEAWDCETIITTYSNLDNHPGKIEAETIRKKKLAATVAGALSNGTNVISLGGKQKLPVDFLPHTRKANMEKVKVTGGLTLEQQKRKPHGQETKEEKKERKSAVKEGRREARRVKKEMKGIYRSEAQRAQGVAATSGPSSIHLM